MHAARECDRFNIAQSNSLKSQEQNTYSTYDGTVVFTNSTALLIKW